MPEMFTTTNRNGDKIFRKFGYEKVFGNKFSFAYKITKLGTQEDPFPNLIIPFPTMAREIAKSLNEAYHQGYQKAETLHEITKGVLE